MTCIYCGEIYTPQEVKELKQRGEEYALGDNGFICPDCWDSINRRPVEDQVMDLLKKGELHGRTVLQG